MILGTYAYAHGSFANSTSFQIGSNPAIAKGSRPHVHRSLGKAENLNGIFNQMVAFGPLSTIFMQAKQAAIALIGEDVNRAIGALLHIAYTTVEFDSAHFARGIAIYLDHHDTPGL